MMISILKLYLILLSLIAEDYFDGLKAQEFEKRR